MCNNNSKHTHLSLLKVFMKNNAKIGEQSGDDILHGEPELLIFLMLSFSKGFHGLSYHILHLIPGNSGRLCIV